MLSSMVTKFINIYIIVTVFIILFIKKKYYEYKKEEEEQEQEEERIFDLEYKFQFYSDKIFYLTVFKILFKNKMLTNFVEFDKMMEEAFILYNEDHVFRNECYKHGIRRRFLEYMEENKKTR